MLWIKSLHLFFVAGWFVGLFYLPRILANLAQVPNASLAERGRLLLMARKLFRFMTIIAPVALASGLILWLYYGIGRGADQAWMHVKLAMAALLVIYHAVCGRILETFMDGTQTHRPVWFSYFNEIPIVLLLVVILMVVVKPF